MSWIWVLTLNKSAYYYDFWRSCHTEDCSNDAENTALITFEHQCISIHTYKCVFSESALNFLWWRRRNRKLMNQTLTDGCLGNTVPLTWCLHHHHPSSLLTTDFLSALQWKTLITKDQKYIELTYYTLNTLLLYTIYNTPFSTVHRGHVTQHDVIKVDIMCN